MSIREKKKPAIIYNTINICMWNMMLQCLITTQKTAIRIQHYIHVGKFVNCFQSNYYLHIFFNSNNNHAMLLLWQCYGQRIIIVRDILIWLWYHLMVFWMQMLLISFTVYNTDVKFCKRFSSYIAATLKMRHYQLRKKVKFAGVQWWFDVSSKVILTAFYDG